MITAGLPLRDISGLYGLLAVDKPAGLISKDVSRLITKEYRRVRIGHVGTLDPMASGVLPILFGEATKLQDYLLDIPKTYEFDVQFGFETDTLDDEGVKQIEGPWKHISREMITEAILNFTGELDQIPPIYSARKYHGTPLYKYARRQEKEAVPIEGLSRRVTISSFELLDYQSGRAAFRVQCSKGTYVRSLARDLSRSLGTYGTVIRLRRTHAAGVPPENVIKLEELMQSLGELPSLVQPIEKIWLGFPHWTAIESLWQSRLTSGQTLVLECEQFEKGWTCLEDNCMIQAKQNHLDMQNRDCFSRLVGLSSKEGKVFGIGFVQNFGHGKVTIHMKRGLLL